MYKRIFFHSLLAGVLAAIACIIYDRIYFFATEADYSKVLNTVSLIAVNLAACFVAGGGLWIIKKLFKKNGDIIFNFTFSILSFASIMVPIAISLPLDIEYPELFPGLAVPMHFFPALAWFTLNPLFSKEERAK